MYVQVDDVVAEEELQRWVYRLHQQISQGQARDEQQHERHGHGLQERSRQPPGLPKSSSLGGKDGQREDRAFGTNAGTKRVRPNHRKDKQRSRGDRQVGWADLCSTNKMRAGDRAVGRYVRKTNDTGAFSCCLLERPSATHVREEKLVRLAFRSNQTPAETHNAQRVFVAHTFLPSQFSRHGVKTCTENLKGRAKHARREFVVGAGQRDRP